MLDEDQEVGTYLQEMLLRILRHLSFQTVGKFSCVTLQIKKEELMLKHDILIGIRASNMEYIHQALYLHADKGPSYYLIVDFGERLLNRWKAKW